MLLHGSTKLGRLLTPLIILSALGLGACGQTRPSSDDASDLEWTQSRAGTARYAYLSQDDLTDEFLFGVSVINVEDFLSSSLNMVVRPLAVKLKVRTSGSTRKLDVMRTSDNRIMMSFDVTIRSGKFEVDFASVGNDVKLRSLLDVNGGAFTAGSNDGYWVSSGAPSVLNVSQDTDTMVVDLLHTVSQATLATDAQGRTTVGEVVSAHPGKVTIRLFLKRKSSLPRLGAERAVAQGQAQHIGFFGADMTSDDTSRNIQRFALGETQQTPTAITFYLKDVPAAFQGIATEAVKSWNAALGPNTMRVAIAPDGVDVGDPRYNVIKWFDGLDKDVNWAGVAKMIVDPATGVVMGGDLYVNGSTVRDMYRGVVDFSKRLTASGIPLMSGSIGNVSFTRDEGETPVIPFITDQSQGYDEYMQNYYLETIAHEVGHVLGLRHNFRGSVALEDGESKSVMDYAPRSDRAHYKGPGSYDIAAIRWGYFGEVPSQSLSFCTDEDIWSYYDCSQGDWGSPVDYAINGLLDGTLLLSKSAVAASDDVFIASMGGILENALKIKKLQNQLPAAQRADVVKRIDAAYSYLYTKTADASLTGSDLATVKSNLGKLHVLAKKTEDDLRSAGRL